MGMPGRVWAMVPLVALAGCERPTRPPARSAAELGCRAGCSTQPRRGAKLHRPATIIAGRWRLSGTARLDPSRRFQPVIRYCCVAWGAAVGALGPTLPGRWRLRLDFAADCDEATAVELIATRSGSSRVLEQLPLSAATPVLRRCPIPLRPAPGEKLFVAVTALGGLTCCGKTRLFRAALEQASSSWSANRCRLLRRGLRAAMQLGSAEIERYLADLPP